MLADKAEFLQQIPLFQDLDQDGIDKLVECLEIHHYEPDEVLFRQGEPGDVLYIVYSGQVKIVTRQHNAVELVVNQLGTGDFFGEMSLVDCQPRSAGAVTVSSATLLLLKRTDFLEIVGRHPRLCISIFRGLSAKLRFATGYIEKAIAWSQHISEGAYLSAMSDMEAEQQAQAGLVGESETRIESLIAAFFDMTNDVRRREEQLLSEVQRLRIEIDEARKQQQVAAITDNDRFRQLLVKARSLRNKYSGASND